MNHHHQSDHQNHNILMTNGGSTLAPNHQNNHMNHSGQGDSTRPQLSHTENNSQTAKTNGDNIANGARPKTYTRHNAQSHQPSLSSSHTHQGVQRYGATKHTVHRSSHQEQFSTKSLLTNGAFKQSNDLCTSSKLKDLNHNQPNTPNQNAQEGSHAMNGL